MAASNKPLNCTTPTGLPWSNKPREPTVKPVNLVLTGHRVQRSLARDYAPEIIEQEAADGAVPNLIHALDPSHLIMTVNAAVKEGIINIAAVHDCPAVLAPQAERFKEIILEQLIVCMRSTIRSRKFEIAPSAFLAWLSN
jgi:DNA-directed RNA polymerase